jgi:peptidoglycan biosynthesis protein MviN/MurJ (putative lipid II flippase)
MGNDLYTFLKIAGILSLALWFTSICALFMGAHKARRDFRTKGFLRPPRGLGWIRFLFLKQYEWFETPGVRLYFGASHICLIALLVVIAAVIVYVGSDVMLNGMDAFSLTGPGAPTIQY